jgi:tetratricopeptide (TPR) repeat protein
MLIKGHTYDQKKDAKLNSKLSSANSHMTKGNLDNAIQDYSRAIQLNPDYAEAYNNRGMAYVMKSNNQDAIADFKKVLKLSSDSTLYQQAKQQLDQLENKEGIKKLAKINLDFKGKYRIGNYSKANLEYMDLMGLNFNGMNFCKANLPTINNAKLGKLYES